MKSKKVISSLLVAAMSASLLAGCGGSGDKPAESKPADNTTADNATDTTPAEPAESKPAETPETTSADENTPVEEQTLKVAAFEGGYGADMWSEVTAAFEASHPGVTVELTLDKKLAHGGYGRCAGDRLGATPSGCTKAHSDGNRIIFAVD